MTRYLLSPDLYVTQGDDTLSIGGELTRDNSPILLQWLETQAAVSHLELSELDIEDGVAATYAVNAVRLLLERGAALEIEAAPQVLAHNLYRTGMLQERGITLRAMREDEAYG